METTVDKLICPNCGHELTYERGYDDTREDPGQPESLYCEHCDWDATAGEMEDYVGPIT